MYRLLQLTPPDSAVIEEEEDASTFNKEWPPELKLLIEKSFEKCLNRNEQLTMK